MSNHRLNPCRFGFALGFVGALSMLIMAFCAMHFDYGEDIVDLLATIYPGYGATVQGMFLGILWGFIDYFIFGFIVGWAYNFSAKFCKS